MRVTKLGGEFPPFEQLAEEISPDKHFDGCLYGFPDIEHVSEPAMYHVSGIGAWSLDANENSYVYAHIPVSWAVGQGWDRFRDLVRRWCDILSPVHGTAGLSLLFAPIIGSSYLKYAYGVLKRFPGLDYEEPDYWNNQVRDNIYKIRTINWLTVLGDPLIEAIGGWETMRAALGEDCPIFDCEGGTIIQAGPEPELGDINFGVIPRKIIVR